MSNSAPAEDYISGGYFIVRPIDRPAAMPQPELLPERIITLSRCLATIFPDDWPLPWARQYTEDERINKAAQLGVPRNATPGVMNWVNDHFDSGDR